MATAVVFGATGFAGGAIAAELVSRGHSVIGVARDVSKLATPEIHAREGSLTDLPFFAEVVAEADYLVLATHALLDGGDKVADRVPELLSSTTGPLRLGVVGGAGSLRLSQDGPLFMEIPEFPDFAKPEASAQADLYRALHSSESAADWFYVSPPAGFGAQVPGERTGTYRVAEGDLMLTRDGAPTSISGADFATAFVAELDQPTMHRVRFTVGY